MAKYEVLNLYSQTDEFSEAVAQARCMLALGLSPVIRETETGHIVHWGAAKAERERDSDA